MRPGEETVVEKIVSIFTSRDTGISEPGREACDWAMHVAGDFDDLLEHHVVSWRHIWDRTRTELGCDGDLVQALHLNVFHLLQTVSNNSVGLDVGVPARGLHGEAYRGHVFWDELFIFPFLSLRLPQLARALLLYRYRRMDQARRSAADAGYSGAMFPWQSASSGREVTQTMHLNPNSGRWLPDASRLQRHVNAAIAYNTWQYFQATGDLEFLRFFGAEMILEIARFWASAATYDHTLDRYEIKNVMGPDEYHDGYPDRSEPGLDNNAYTNVMAVWCLCRAFDTLAALPPVSARELKERLELTEQELDRWGDISRKMRLCFHDDVISQFEGYELLDELDFEAYRERYGDISRLDRILENEGDSTNRYQVAKQADVMMLFFVLSEDELARLLERLGYPCDDELIPRCIDVLRAPHRARLDAQSSRPRVDSRAPRPGAVVAALRRGPAQRRRRSAGRDHEGGDPSRGHGRNRRPDPAWLRGHRDPRRRAPVEPRDPGGAGFARPQHPISRAPRAPRAHDGRRPGARRPDEGAPITIDVNGALSTVQPGQLVEVRLDGSAGTP